MTDKLPQRLDTYEQFQAFDKAQAELALKDPIQAVCNLRWMMYRVWDRWSSLDLAVRLRLEHETKKKKKEGAN